MVIKEASYSIEVGKNNPYIKPIACIIAGVALALPLIFVLLLWYDILQISPRGVVIAISMYAGLLMIGIVVSLTAPTFIGAAKAVTLTGKIVDFIGWRSFVFCAIRLILGQKGCQVHLKFRGFLFGRNDKNEIQFAFLTRFRIISNTSVHGITDFVCISDGKKRSEAALRAFQIYRKIARNSILHSGT